MRGALSKDEIITALAEAVKVTGQRSHWEWYEGTQLGGIRIVLDKFALALNMRDTELADLVWKASKEE